MTKDPVIEKVYPCYPQKSIETHNQKYTTFHLFLLQKSWTHKISRIRHVKQLTERSKNFLNTRNFWLSLT